MAFSVLIVGGSVAGLALANMLEKYGIEYTLIEKHDIIAPQLGASFTILPQAARIIDQLGCFEKVRALGTPVNDGGLFGPDGNALNTDPNAGDNLEALLGYKMWALERRQIVDILYQNLADKSRVYTSCGAMKVEYLEHSARVETQNGRVFTGSIVVGADGVHSRIRQEMWNAAVEGVEGIQVKKDQEAIRSIYSCIFGISEGLQQSDITSTSRTCYQDRNYLYQRSVQGKIYWFAFSKNAKQTQGRDIPRYTDEDKEKAIARFGDDILQSGITLGDLYKHRKHAVLVPLEEYVMGKCYHRRTILIGDSLHKVHPLSGQGGASALESAAYLANQLKELTDNGNVPTDEQIQAAFADFEQNRGSRTKDLMNDGHTLARLESLDSTFLKFLMLHLVSRISKGYIQSMLAEACTPGVSLKYLPSASKRGIVPYEDEVDIRPQKRKVHSTVIWTSVFTLIGLVQFVPFWDAPAVNRALVGQVSSEENWPWNTEHQSESASSPLQMYTAISVIAINAFWCLESYRSQLLIGPLCSVVPFILVALFAGWGVAMAAYFALYILLSHKRVFYYPSPRTIPLPAAKALPIALVLVYPIAIYRTFAEVSMNVPKGLSGGLRFQPLLVAHASFPFIVTLVKEILKRLTDIPKGLKATWGDADIPYVSRYQGLIFVTTSSAHLLFMVTFALRSSTQTPLYKNLTDKAVTQPVFINLSIILWLLFTVWDLRRVHATNIDWKEAIFYITLGTFLVGPTGCLAVAWKWREGTLERSRTRKATREKRMLPCTTGWKGQHDIMLPL